MVDEFVSHTMPIESINEAVALMKKGEWYVTLTHKNKK